MENDKYDTGMIRGFIWPLGISDQIHYMITRKKQKIYERKIKNCNLQGKNVLVSHQFLNIVVVNVCKSIWE